MCHTPRVGLRTIAACLCGIASFFAQDPAPGNAPVFRSSTHLALVSFHVTASKVHITGLRASDFLILEDGQPRDITVFHTGGAPLNLPIDIALLFDSTKLVRNAGYVSSMGRRGLDFLDESLFQTDLLSSLPTAIASLYVFDGDLLRVTGPTREAETLRQGFGAVINRGPGEQLFKLGERTDLTYLYEAIATTLTDIGRSPNPAVRVLVVVSSGLSLHSRRTPREVAERAQGLGVAIIPVTLGHQTRRQDYHAWTAQTPSPVVPPEAHRTSTDRLTTQFQRQEAEVKAFLSLADETGGQAFDPPQLDAATMREILRAIADRVRNTYVVGFLPTASGRPREHTVEVRLRQDRPGTTLSGSRRVIVH